MARPADKVELAAFRKYWLSQRVALLKNQSISAEDADRRALAEVCRVIFNLIEFVYTD